MRIAFRADASVQIGTGHVMRCLTLADALRAQGHECLFICRDHPGNLSELVAQRGFELHPLRQETGALHSTGSEDAATPEHAQWLGVAWQQDAAQTLNALNGIKTDWLVVDHYALDAHWERRLGAQAYNIMVIDDLADRPHQCQLLLDQNLGREAQDYNGLIPETCTRLIGPHYALLRQEFAELRDASLERRKTPKLERILITLGGVDQNNVTAQVLDALAQSSLPPETELDIVMGASAPALEQVRRQAETLPYRATVGVNVTDMAKRMCTADFCIGAAGSTSWERCCLGLPTVTMVLAENQKEAAEAIARQGAAFVIKNTEHLQTELDCLLTDNQLAEKLVAMSKAGTSLVDGLGCQRVINHLGTD